MRVLARGDTLGPGRERMAAALGALARRGHEVEWLAAGGRPAGPAEVVVGGAGAPFRVARAGWRAGARVMLLDLDLDALGRWRWIDRWAWDAGFSAGLVADGEAARLAADPRGLARERVGLWSAGPPATAPDAAHPDTEVLERACERALARQRGGAARPAVFLDRDGTLVREVGYLADPDAVELLPGVGAALRGLVETEAPVVVVSNQSGVGRGRFAEAAVHAVNARLRALLRGHGVELAAIYFCPHRPEEDCPCRKPRPGLLERAAEDLHLALGASVMIGDKRIDAAAGRRAGGRGVLVRTGYGREEERADGGGEPPPDRVFDDLAAALDWWTSAG